MSTRTAAAVDQLAAMQPITLDELNAVAALQTRVDRKYLVPRAALAKVLDQLGDDCNVLDFDGARDSLYESVYFDTPDLDSYLSAAHKRRRRFKIRTRAYLDTGVCFLEVKTAGGRSLTSCVHSPDDCHRPLCPRTGPSGSSSGPLSLRYAGGRGIR